MNKIDRYKTIIGSTIKQVNKGKIVGDLCMSKLYLFKIISDLIETCKINNEHEIQLCLEKKLRKLQNKYPDICTYRTKTFNSTFITGKPNSDLNIVKSNSIKPVVTDNDCYDYEFETIIFSLELFNNLYTSVNTIGHVKIISLPNVGTLTYNNSTVIVNQIIDINNINLLAYNYGDLVSEGENVTFTFQLSDNTINHIFSDTATFTICVPEQENEPPTYGDLELNVEGIEPHIFTVNNFTIDLSPVYNDREGDLPENLRITSLPTNGTLLLDDVEVEINDVITFVQIEAGLFTFEPDYGEEDYTITFGFQISDEGSGEYGD